MEKIPDRLYIDEDARRMYERLEEEVIFKGKTRKEQFLFAMAFGFKNILKVSLKRNEGLFLTKDLKHEDEALINALAIYDSKSVEVLSDKGKVFRIAEEYANGGIRLLIDKIDTTQFGSFEKALEEELVKKHSAIKK